MIRNITVTVYQTKESMKGTYTCIGIFTTTDKCPAYLKAGARKVIMNTPNTDVPIFVVGISLRTYGTSLDMISNVSYIQRKAWHH